MNQKSDPNTYYLVTYRDPKQNDVVSLKAKSIRDSSLGISFVTISDFIFDTSGPVLNPVDENLEKRFKDTKSLHMLVYNILSIEEIGLENQGLKFEKDKSNLIVIAPENSGDLPSL